MNDDEEKQLRQELLDLDLKLRRKQEFWETPRNLAILVGVVAAIAAAIGFWLGRGSQLAPLLLRPIIDGGFNSMRPDQFVDAVQTAGIVVIAAMLVYVVIRLDRTLTAAAEQIRQALTIQRALQESLERLCRRVETLEKKQD